MNRLMSTSRHHNGHCSAFSRIRHIIFSSPVPSSPPSQVPSGGTGRTRLKLLLWLFGVNLYISSFTFGGGYVVIPMIRKCFVERKNLFEEAALSDMAAIAQSSPGAIAVNLSILAGFRVAGMAGAVVSAIGAVLPPFFILSFVTVCYDAFRSNPLISAALAAMQAGAAALVIDVVCDMIRAVRREKQPLLSLLIPITFIAVFLFHIDIVWIILGTVLLGALASHGGATPDSSSVDSSSNECT